MVILYIETTATLQTLTAHICQGRDRKSTSFTGSSASRAIDALLHSSNGLSLGVLTSIADLLISHGLRHVRVPNVLVARQEAAAWDTNHLPLYIPQGEELAIGLPCLQLPGVQPNVRTQTCKCPSTNWNIWKLCCGKVGLDVWYNVVWL